MKRFISILLVAVMVLVTIGCANPKTIDGITYDTYGLVNEGEKRNDDIEYRLVTGNIVWSVILSATVVAPLYFVGWSLYEPVGKRAPNAVKGQIGN